ncbi:MAG TPA: NAD(P)H-dependent oxidoreductase [Rhizomicrobium sp.]
MPAGPDHDLNNRSFGNAHVRKQLLVVNGHPDPRSERFCAALCDAYEAGAHAGGWETRRLNVGALAFSDIAARDEVSIEMMDALGNIGWSSQLAIVYPLWLNRPPTGLHTFFDYLWRRHQTADPNVANFERLERVARIIVTMDMPALIYRSLDRRGNGGREGIQTLSLPGIRSGEPILIGSVNTISSEQRRLWLEAVRLYGEQGALVSLFPYRKSC